MRNDSAFKVVPEQSGRLSVSDPALPRIIINNHLLPAMIALGLIRIVKFAVKTRLYWSYVKLSEQILDLITAAPVTIESFLSSRRTVTYQTFPT